MRASNRASVGIQIRPVTLVGLFFLGLMIASPCQDDRFWTDIPIQKTGERDGEFKIRITVDEVRLDAVVLDSKGRQVTDLTAEDFEIRQDGRPQKITSCTYINNYLPPPPMADRIPRDSKVMPVIPTPMLEREDVKRMIGFVVDNLSMRFEDVHFARQALKKFVEKQMQPGDVVAIVQTANGSAARQLFSNDRQYLLSAIDRLRWFMDARVIKRISTQYMAIDYFIKAMWDMPGRKSLILITAQPTLPTLLMPDIGRQLQDWKPTSVERAYMGDSLNSLADKALRAGVVIHTMDIRGLQGPEVYDPTFGADRAGSGSLSSSEDPAGSLDPDAGLSGPALGEAIARTAALRQSESPLPISQKTGGLFVQGTNWFRNGIGPVNEALKGYYMLTYSPPLRTFRTPLYHRTEIRVKRSGLAVHTRDGFIGATKSMDESLEAPITVRDAIYYPFRNSDLDVNLASGYIDDPRKGYLLRYNMHLEGKNLSVVEGKEGNNSIYVDVACITSNMDKFIQDAGNLKYEFRIKNENIPWIREHGLRFSLDLPVKNPGAYYVRAAVRDQISGKAGSAYQFIDIPNLTKNRLSLSNIFMMNRDEDAPWIPVQAQEESRNLLYPDMRRDPRKSPAIRSFLPGEDFDFAAMIYNAAADAANKPDLVSQVTLYANGKELHKGAPETVDLSDVTDFKRIPVRKKLTLGNSVSPGDYILILQVTDKRAKDKYNLAMQALDFRVLEKAVSGSIKKLAEREEKSLPPEVLAQYAGTYSMGPDMNVAITQEENRLFTQVTGEVKLPLYAESETKFFLKAVAGAENEFVKDDGGSVTHMIVRRGKEETTVPRISSQVVERKEIELSNSVLEQYVGTYRLDKKLVVQITLESGSLYSRIPGQRMYQLCPESETRFFLKKVANAETEFVKDSKGNITHMILRQGGSEKKANRISKKVKNQ
jgi:VWFA-related protein